MSKIAVVYWSGTGNTEAMANEVAEGAKAAGAEVDVLTASEFGADKMDAYDAVAFGCPAMGAMRIFPPIASRIPPTDIVGSFFAARKICDSIEVVVVLP